MKKLPSSFNTLTQCVLLFFLFSASGLYGQELVVNGSFENISNTFVPDGNQEMSLPTNSTVIPGWTVVSGELTWGNNSNVFGPQTPYGAYLLDLTGYHDTSPYGGVTQTLSTAPGVDYRVSISLGEYEPKSIYNGPVSAMVVAGSVSNIFTLGTTTTNGNQWNVFEIDFTASSSTTTIQIIGNLAHGGHYIGLDNASLTLQSGGPELLVNGSFENTGGTFVPDGNNVMSLGVGSTVIPGWTIVSGEIVW